MNKRIFATALLALSTLMVTAQSKQKVTSGITAGISSGSVRISGIDNRFTGFINGENIFGVEAGLFLKIKMDPFYVRPAAEIQYKRGTVDMVNSEGTTYTKSDFKMTRLEVPLLFGVNVIGRVNAEVGPVYNHVIGVTDRFSIYTADVPHDGLGYRAGANAQLGCFTLGISYQSIKNISITRGTFESPDEWILSAAYTFGSKPGMAPYGK